MRQSSVLEFESSAFAIEPGEDEHTNPGLFGKSLAHWLSEQLDARGLAPGRVIPEDFGWCVPVRSSPHHLYVACAATGEPNGWMVFAFAEGGLMARIFGSDEAGRDVASLFAALKDVLGSAPHVQSLREIPR